jgi:hypothetical protein
MIRSRSLSLRIIVSLILCFFVCLVSQPTYLRSHIPKKRKKFFHELHGHPHLDNKYGIPTSQHGVNIQKELVSLYVKFNSMTKDIDIHPILMYGGLIGYHFNERMLPWDDDIDLIVIGKSEIERLVTKDKWEDSDCVFMINPNYNNKDHLDVNNKIDARMISKRIGVFIDFTFFWANSNNQFYAKDTNIYHRDMLIPSKRGVFHGIDVYIPNRYIDCLVKSYGGNVTSNTYKNWIFDVQMREWVPNNFKT